MQKALLIGITALLSAGCTAKTVDSGLDSNGLVDSSTDDTGATDDTGSEPQRAAMAVTFKEVLADTLLPGVTVDVDGQQVTSDAEGFVEFTLAGEQTHVIQATAPGFMDVHHPVYAASRGLRGTFYMLSDQTAAALTQALGLTLDPNKGQVQVIVHDIRTSPYGSVHGATVNLSASYDVALHSDGESPYGVAAGNTTDPTDGIRAAVYFINVPPGDFTLEIGFPEGSDLTSCSWGLGGPGFDEWSAPVTAGVYNEVLVYCE
ncbi:MAG: hypothetical protein H6741_30780 [Alphaproteobacteria bacterium]|nr:hypothetical protein [Alphaproteobacteria bacterium]